MHPVGQRLRLERILERAARLDDAMRLWRGAFNEGSRDPETANRLTMHLERAKDYEGAASAIRQALARGLPANVVESLRKRLARCQGKRGYETEDQDVVRDSLTRVTQVVQLRGRWPALATH